MKKIRSNFIPHFLCLVAVLFNVISPVCAVEPQKNSSYSSQGMDIVLLVDNSRTMWERHFDDRQKDDPLSLRNDAMRAAVNVIVGSNIRIGFVYFANTAYKHYSLQYVISETEYHDVCRKYLDISDPYPTNIDTNIDEGINGAIQLFDKDSDRKKVIVLFSDGIDDTSSETVEKLLEDDIELHCISVNSENDEELRRLVNYQKNSHEYDNRFASVTPDNLQELYDKFTEKFFGFRGDVRYKKIDPDSDYSYSFSVPELAVSKFQLYIRGTDISAELNKVSDSSVQKAESEEWNKFDHCTFMTVKNPGKSQYSLQLSSSEKENLNNATVILAYYTDLLAEAMIEPIGDDGIIRGHDNRLKIQFFDGDKKMVAIDSKAVITAYADILKEDGTIVPKEISVIEKSGQYCISDSFTLDDFGELQIRLSVSFGKNIGIDYIFDTFGESDTKIKIVPHSPETIKKYSSDTINAEKIQNGSQKKFLFTIPLEEYIRDIDSSLAEMKVSNFRSYSNHNSFTAYAENERLVIKADNEGIINGFVELKDESGNTTKLDIEGSIKAMGGTNPFWMVVLFITVMFLLVGGLRFWRYFIARNESEVVRAVKKNLKEIVGVTVRQKIAKAVEPIFEEIDFDELEPKIPDAFNERIKESKRANQIVPNLSQMLGKIDSYEKWQNETGYFREEREERELSLAELIQIIKEVIEQIISEEKESEIANIVKKITGSKKQKNVLEAVKKAFTEVICIKHIPEIVAIIVQNSSENTNNDTVSDTGSYSGTSETDEQPAPGQDSIQFNIRVKDKKRNKSYRLAKPGINEEHPWYRILGDFDSLSGCKVCGLPEKDRPDTEIRFESGREADVPVIYVKKGNETKVVRYGETLDWLDMEIKLNK